MKEKKYYWKTIHFAHDTKKSATETAERITREKGVKTRVVNENVGQGAGKHAVQKWVND
jgi:hypothetical protein